MSHVFLQPGHRNTKPRRAGGEWRGSWALSGVSAPTEAGPTGQRSPPNRVPQKKPRWAAGLSNKGGGAFSPRDRIRKRALIHVPEKRQRLCSPYASACPLPRADPVGTLKELCTLINALANLEGLPLRSVVPIIAALVTVVTANVSLAQSTATPPPESGTTCPPDVKGEPPTVGGGSSEPLSDKLVARFNQFERI